MYICPNHNILYHSFEKYPFDGLIILFLPIEILEPKPYKSFINKDLKTYFEKYGLTVKSEKHCDYSKVLILKKINYSRE